MASGAPGSARPADLRPDPADPAGGRAAPAIGPDPAEPAGARGSPPVPSSGRRVFLTGATGFVGSHVARVLVSRGDRVRCLVREGSPTANLEGLRVERVAGDLLDAASLRAVMEGCAAVFHCAADYRLWAPDPAEIYRTNVQGTRNVLRAAADAGVGRVVHTSSVGALGHSGNGTPADEETPVAVEDMAGHYERSKFLAERAAEAWARRGLPVVIVNPSTTVGEGDIRPTPTGRVIVEFLTGRLPAYVDTGLNLVDVRDVAAGHLLAEERGTPGRRYILGSRNLSLEEMLGLLAQISGHPAPPRRLPHWAALAYAAAEEARSRLSGRSPRVSLEGARMARRRMWFDPARAVRELGFRPGPVEEALARAVAWFRRRGYVEA